MSFQIDTALVQAYKSNIEIQFQQKGSRLRDTVEVESQNAEFEFYDRIGPTDAVEVTTRHGDTPLISTPHDRRRIATRDFDWADMIDKKDRLRMLADPTSSYTQNAVYAFGRRLDDIIIAAATGVAYTGKTGATTVTFPTTTQQIAVNYVESGGAANSNLTIGKLRRAKFLFDSQECVDEGEQIFCLITASQLQGLLRTTEVTNADYNTVKALVKGEIDTFMGFTFKRLQRLAKSGNNRSVLFYPKTAIKVGLADEVSVDVGPRRDKRNSVQVYACASFGASRMWEEKVVECLCDETT
jgi:hypothetical protein